MYPRVLVIIFPSLAQLKIFSVKKVAHCFESLNISSNLTSFNYCFLFSHVDKQCAMSSIGREDNYISSSIVNALQAAMLMFDNNKVK